MIEPLSRRIDFLPVYLAVCAVLAATTLFLSPEVAAQGESAGGDGGYVGLVDLDAKKANGRRMYHKSVRWPLGMAAVSVVTDKSASINFGIRGVRGDEPVRYFSNLHTEWFKVDAVNILPTVGGRIVKAEYGLTTAADSQCEEPEIMPGCLRVEFPKMDVSTEMTISRRCTMHRYTFPESDEVAVLLPNDSVEQISPTEVWGFDLSRTGDAIWYFMEFSKPFEFSEPEAGGAELQYSMEEGEQLTVRIGLSWSDKQHARGNLEAELADIGFEEARERAVDRWEELLGMVHVLGDSEEDLRTFYTSMYIAFQKPVVVMSDADGTYPPLSHQRNTADRPRRKAADYEHYTDFWTWDTFRASHPALHLFMPGVSRDVARSFVANFRDLGRMPSGPVGTLPKYNMWGTWGEVILADAWAKGIRDFDRDAAMQAALFDGVNVRGGLGGARTHPKWEELGYVPTKPNPRIAKNASATLDFVICDFGIMRLAEFFGKEDYYRTYREKARNYRKLFDPSIGWMRPRLADGEFWADPQGEFDIAGKNNSGFTEATPIEWTFMVPHDVQGLIDLMGGDEAFASRLDRLFETDSMRRWANQMNHHTRYLYNHCGRPWKTQRLIRQLPEDWGRLHSQGDSGSICAVYFWSMIGFYPVTPGVPEYVLGSPYFDRAELHLPGDKTFTIVARDNSPENVYIQSATLNGKPWSRTYLAHGEVVAGGELALQMGPEPNERWGTGPNARPYSLSRDPVPKEMEQ